MLHRYVKTFSMVAKTKMDSRVRENDGKTRWRLLTSNHSSPIIFNYDETSSAARDRANVLVVRYRLTKVAFTRWD
jgi:hypothetical protein